MWFFVCRLLMVLLGERSHKIKFMSHNFTIKSNAARKMACPGAIEAFHPCNWVLIEPIYKRSSPNGSPSGAISLTRISVKISFKINFCFSWAIFVGDACWDINQSIGQMLIRRSRAMSFALGPGLCDFGLLVDHPAWRPINCVNGKIAFGWLPQKSHFAVVPDWSTVGERMCQQFQHPYG